MQTIGTYEAKTRFSELLDRVERGESITITRHGEPVATIIPIQHRLLSDEEAERALQKLRTMRAGVTLGGLSIREMIEEGRA